MTKPILQLFLFYIIRLYNFYSEFIDNIIKLQYFDCLFINIKNFYII